MKQNFNQFLLIILLFINSVFAQEKEISNYSCVFSDNSLDLSTCVWYAKQIEQKDINNKIDLNQGFKKIQQFPLFLNQIFPPEEYGKLRYFVIYTKISILEKINKHLVIHFPVIGENYQIYWNQVLLKSEWYVENQQISKYRTIKNLKVIVDPSYIKKENDLVLILAGYTPITPFNKNDDVGFYLNKGYVLKKENTFLPDFKHLYIPLLIGIYLFTSILLFLFYFFIKIASFLYLSLFCLDISLYYISGDPILFSYFPLIDSQILNKIEYSTLFLSLPLFTTYIRENYFEKKLKIRSFFGFYFYLMLFLALLNLFIDFRISKLLLNLWQIHALFIIIYIIILSFIAIRKKKKYSILIFLGILIIISSAIYDILASIFLFTSLRITIYLFALFIFILALLLSNYIVTKNREYKNILKEQQVLLQIYKRFFPEKILNLIHKESIIDLRFDESYQLKGIILVSDLRDFTHLTEAYGSEKVFDSLNRYYSIIEKMIREYGGEIVDFYGDQYIAFFPSENPYRSDAIIELILKIEKTKDQFDITLKHGYGLEYGTCIMNFVGSSDMARLYIAGIDVENTKLYEKITKFYQTLIICSENIYSGIKEYKDKFVPLEIIPDDILLSKQLYYFDLS